MMSIRPTYRISCPAAGFTLIEAVVATAILLGVMGAVFSMTNPLRGTFQAQLEASDMHQRLRVAVDTIGMDLQAAGAGATISPRAGPLSDSIAPIMPHRISRRGGDAGTFREDTIGLLHVPSTAAQATIRLPEGEAHLPRNATEVMVNPRAYCGASAPLCGFAAGMRALIFDQQGAWDLVTITTLHGETLQLEYDGMLSANYTRDSYITQISADTYYLNADTRTNTFQLRHYDGYQSDVPVVDDVVGLSFHYFGESQPPQLLPGKSPGDERGPWTTYGPRPVPLGQENGTGGWDAGENCVFTVSQGEHAARLAPLANRGVVALEPAIFTDGPWCPGPSFTNRFDADLLRIRRVQVVIRVQVAAAALRGPAGLLFTRGGTSTSAERYVPDVEVRVDVSPRNLNVGR